MPQKKPYPYRVYHLQLINLQDPKAIMSVHECTSMRVCVLHILYIIVSNSDHEVKVPNRQASTNCVVISPTKHPNNQEKSRLG